MVPNAYSSFFMAATGAGAALIGLLFVAVSIRPARLDGAETHPLVRATTASTFSALVNGFFISFTALLPGTNIGATTLGMGAIGAFNAVLTGGGLVWQLPRYRRERKPRGGVWLQVARGLPLIAVSLFIYGYELWYAVRVLRNPADADAVYAIGILVVAAFGLGLVRAWELLGERRTGLLSRLTSLSDLMDRDQQGAAPTPARVAAPDAANAPGISARPDVRDEG